MSIIVTGGAGFIGSNFIIDWLDLNDQKLINLDKLTYAGNPQNLINLKNNPNYIFVKGDICDKKLIDQLFNTYKPQHIINFASETHVDKSIDSPADFIYTNIVGTFKLLESTRIYWNNLKSEEKENFRFLHVSTDEVYGSLDFAAPSFNETHPYKPNSPYSASKASSDHLVRTYHHTYSIPVLTTHCSNNYGPYQFPEKLIPLVIYNALAGKKFPLYGDGQQVRDWLYVGDHCDAIRQVLEKGKVGEVYNIGGCNQKTNLEVVEMICDILDMVKPRVNGDTYKSQITFVKDRFGHDRRYSIDTSKIKKELHWQPTETFETGIKKTIQWYIDNQEWVKKVTGDNYHHWINKHYK